MDIVELGLFYDVEIDGPKVKVIHTLTSMGCPAGPMIQEDIHNATAAVEGVEEVEVELTFDPPWTPDKMSDDAKFILGYRLSSAQASTSRSQTSATASATIASERARRAASGARVSDAASIGSSRPSR